MTTLRTAVLALSCAAATAASVGLAAPAAAEDQDIPALYCVTKDPDYLLGQQVHPGYTFCVPVPERAASS